VVIEAVSPEVDGGRFPSKRSLGERVAIEADVFADGHDAIACVMRYRHQSESSWTELPMAALGNDRWRAEFTAGELGRYLYTFEAWVDRFLTWRLQLAKRLAAGQEVAPELEIGAKLVEAAAGRAQGADSAALMKQAEPIIEGQVLHVGRSELVFESGGHAAKAQGLKLSKHFRS